MNLKNETIQAIVNYLGSQPYAHVAGLIQDIQQQVQEQQKPELVKNDDSDQDQSAA
jgi:hypothetical protein